MPILTATGRASRATSVNWRSAVAPTYDATSRLRDQRPGAFVDIRTKGGRLIYHVERRAGRRLGVEGEVSLLVEDADQRGCGGAQ